MNKRTHPKPQAPTDEEILSYDNVPVDIAARYLDWPEKTLRLYLRENQDILGAAIKDKGLTFKVSPGKLVRYKRGDPCMDYEALKSILKDVVRQVVREEMRGRAYYEQTERSEC